MATPGYRQNGRIVPAILFEPDAIGVSTATRLFRLTHPMSPQSQGTGTRYWAGLSGFGMSGNRYAGKIAGPIQDFRGLSREVNRPSSATKSTQTFPTASPGGATVRGTLALSADQLTNFGLGG